MGLCRRLDNQRHDIHLPGALLGPHHVIPKLCPRAVQAGRIENTIWVSPVLSMAVMRLRVVWGRAMTMATFCPIKAFRSVDLPVFGLPTRRQIPISASASSVSSLAPAKSADLFLKASC